MDEIVTAIELYWDENEKPQISTAVGQEIRQRVRGFNRLVAILPARRYREELWRLSYLLNQYTAIAFIADLFETRVVLDMASRIGEILDSYLRNESIPRAAEWLSVYWEAESELREIHEQKRDEDHQTLGPIADNSSE